MKKYVKSFGTSLLSALPSSLLYYFGSVSNIQINCILRAFFSLRTNSHHVCRKTSMSLLVNWFHVTRSAMQYLDHFSAAKTWYLYKEIGAIRVRRNQNQNHFSSCTKKTYPCQQLINDLIRFRFEGRQIKKDLVN